MEGEKSPHNAISTNTRLPRDDLLLVHSGVSTVLCTEGRKVVQSWPSWLADKTPPEVPAVNPCIYNCGYNAYTALISALYMHKKSKPNRKARTALWAVYHPVATPNCSAAVPMLTKTSSSCCEAGSAAHRRLAWCTTLGVWRLHPGTVALPTG